MAGTAPTTSDGADLGEVESLPAPDALPDAFRVYEVERTADGARYYGEPTSERDTVVQRVAPQFRDRGYRVSLTRETGEHVLVARERSTAVDGIPWLNLVLFLGTVATTLLAGVGWYGDAPVLRAGPQRTGDARRGHPDERSPPGPRGAVRHRGGGTAGGPRRHGGGDRRRGVAPAGLAVNPVLVGGWVGAFVTFLNMLPVGQLDGAHVARALAGEGVERLRYVVPVALLGLAAGVAALVDPRSATVWVVWGLLALLVGRAGTAAPLSDDPVGPGRTALGVLAFLLGALCFTPVPITLVG